MKSPTVFKLGGILLAAALALLSGCQTTEKCDKDNVSLSGGGVSPRGFVRAELKAPAVDSSATTGAAAAKDALVKPKFETQQLALTATKSAPAAFESFPNNSFGKFTAQGTVAFGPDKGFREGSAIGLEFEQLKHSPSLRRLYLVASKNPANSGFTVKVRDFIGINTFGTLNIANTTQVDLRIQQTDTALVFSARATPLNQSAAGWMQVYSDPGAPDPAAFHLSLGMLSVDAGATAYFSNLAIDGEGIGGLVEHTIIADLGTSRESVLAARDKLEAGAALNGVLADLDIALADQASAIDKLNLGLADFAIQRPVGSILALKLLKTAAKDLATARAVVNLGDAKKAQAQSGKLQTIAGAEAQAIMALIGWKAPSLKSAPPILSLQIP